MTDVARVAGVSAITVSRALRSSQSVAPETFERIVAAVRETGYVPNQVAGNLRSQRTRLVVAIIPSIQHSYLSNMIQGLSDSLVEAGMNLLLSTSRESLEEEERLVATLLAQKPCAIVLHNTAHTNACRQLLTRAGVPVVETGDLVRRPIYVSVSYSNFSAAKAMTLHLIERGRRRIAFVGGESSNERARERLRGYKAALRHSGIRMRSAWVLEAKQGLQSGAAALNTLIGLGSRPDAIFFATDTLAVGALLEAQRLGIDVPEDLAIAGYDDSDLAAQITPSLTAIRIPRYEIGQAAAELLLHAIDAPTDAISRDLGFEIIIREST